MSAIGSNIFSIARSAIHAHQLAVQVSANNISNAETAGYTRQRALLSPGDPARVHPGWVGTGVRALDVTRMRDSLLDVGVRRESSNASGFGVRRDLLAQVESVLGEPSETGLAAGLDAFWNAWSDLANDPTSGSAKSAVQQRGAQVAASLNGFDRRLAEVGESAALRFEASVGELNGLLRQVADLNERIVAAEVGGNTAGDLRDMRDTAVDSISRFAEVQVIQRQDRTYGLVIGGATVVDGNQARTLTGQSTPEGLVLRERSQVLARPGGQLEGLMRTAADIGGVRKQLDTMAAQLVEQVNAVHGRSAEGEPAGPPFFAVDGTSAGSIALAEGVRRDASSIRAGRPELGSADNSIALELARFREQRFEFSIEGGPERSVSFGEFYRGVVTDLAFGAGEADREATAAEALVSQAETRRQSANGVSIDEELILLMRHQQAYTAASRLISTADEMVKAILQLV